MNLSPQSWIEHQADFVPEKIALYFDGEAISYAMLEQRISTLARMLKHRLALGRGDRIGFLGLNSPDFIALIFAAARLGAIVVPLNWRLAPPEHSYILQDAGIDVLIAEPEFVATIDQIRANHPDCKFVAQRVSAKHWLSFDELIEAVDGDDHNPHVGYDCPLLIVYTSGTTGHPKGAVLTPRSAVMERT